MSVSELDEAAGGVEVAYRVAWEGPADAWVVAPPSIPVVENVEWSSVSAVASASEAESTIVYKTHVTGDPGEYSLPSVAFSVKGEGDSTTITSEAVSVSIPAATTPPNPVVFGAAIATLVVIGAGVLIASRRKVTATGPVGADGESTDIDEEDLMAIASKRRIEGDAYGFYRSLAEAARSDAGLVERLQRSAEDAGFRGVEFTADQMDQDYRAVERIVAGRDKENDE